MLIALPQAEVKHYNFIFAWSTECDPVEVSVAEYYQLFTFAIPALLFQIRNAEDYELRIENYATYSEEVSWYLQITTERCFHHTNKRFRYITHKVVQPKQTIVGRHVRNIKTMTEFNDIINPKTCYLTF
jgi:hypothetical protein